MKRIGDQARNLLASTPRRARPSSLQKNGIFDSSTKFPVSIPSSGNNAETEIGQNGNASTVLMPSSDSDRAVVDYSTETSPFEVDVQTEWESDEGHITDSFLDTEQSDMVPRHREFDAGLPINGESFQNVPGLGGRLQDMDHGAGDFSRLSSSRGAGNRRRMILLAAIGLAAQAGFLYLMVSGII